MGLYKRKDSHYYWMSYRVDGKRVCVSTKTKNKQKAELIYAKVINDIREYKWFGYSVDQTVTLSEVLDRYMKEVSPNLSPSTDFRNSQMVKNFKAFFGDVLLKDVTSSVVSRYKALCLEKSYSKETILRELGLLRRIFNIAIDEWELCKNNPVPKVLRTLGKINGHRVRYLSPEEAQKLTVALPSWLRPIVTIARHTGLRRSNILELTWEQVDLGRGVIIIPRTKNGSPIGIPLNQMAVKTLTEGQKIRHLHSPYVFCDSEGIPHSPFKVSMSFKRACKRAGIENFRFHDLRHDFASGMRQANVDIQTIKELLGHKDLRMTLRYSHLSPENLREAVNVLDARELRSATFSKEKELAVG